MTHLDLGTLGAKRKGDTELLAIMRQVVANNPNETDPAKIVYLFVSELDDIQTRDALEYAGYNIFRRVWRDKPVAAAVTVKPDEPKRPTSVEIQKRAKEIIESGIVLWHMQVPGVGKPLNECTFGELADAAPLTGRFLARLARQGAPGTLVREVFKDEEHLQDFWTTCQ